METGPVYAQPLAMRRQTQSRQRHPLLRAGLAWLCVLLVLAVGAAHLLHTHPAGEVADPGCSLCAVAHLSVIETPVIATPVAVHAFTPVRLPAEHAPPAATFPPSTYVRPPPALTPNA